MKTTRKTFFERGAMDLLEDGSNFLRNQSPGQLAILYAGSVPFVLGFLYFWVDMNQSALAAGRLGGESLVVALLYGWMKTCQAVYMNQLRRESAGENPELPNGSSWLRIFARQTAIQSTGLLVLPLALIAVLPFPFVLAFYQNVAALEDGKSGSASGLVRHSFHLAIIHPGQNFIATGILVFFSGVVFINYISAGWILPELVHMLFGVESRTSMGGWFFWDKTFAVCASGLTYLTVDPLLRSVQVLRGFRGDSLESGADLRAGLRRFASLGKTGWFVLLVVACWLPGRAAATTDAAPPISRPAQALDHAIDRAIHQEKFLWRLPREQGLEVDSGPGWLGSLLAKYGRYLRIDFHEFLEWLLRHFASQNKELSPAKAISDPNWMQSMRWLLYVLAVAVVTALVVLVLKTQKDRNLPKAAAPAAWNPAPDLTDEATGAEQLPEDDWLRLARELWDRGEFRLAMRAFFLSCLASLARRNLIRLASSKSNQEYARELRRREHALADLPGRFAAIISLFERSWYGTRTASHDTVRELAQKVAQLREDS